MTSVANITLQALKAKQAIQSVGASPIERDPTTGEAIVKGEESDGLVAGGLSSLSIVSLVALAGLSAGTVSFVLVSGSLLVDVASALVMVIAPAVILQKVRLRKFGGFRGQHNLLRQSVQSVRQENERLSQTIDQLDQHTTRLSNVSDDLAAAAKKSGAQVDKLMQMVSDTTAVNAQLRERLQADILQQIMTVGLATDRDRNFCLGPDEIERLIVRLHQVSGVHFHEHNFRVHHVQAHVAGSLTLQEVCAIARTLNDDIVDKDKAVFTYS